MRRLLLRVLVLHWMAVFAVLATVCVVQREAGASAPLHLLGAEAASCRPDGTPTASFLACAFLFSALLFLLSFIESFFAHGPEKEWLHSGLRNAFAAGAFGLTLLLALAALDPGSGTFMAIETLLAASLVSYLAVCAERWATEHQGQRMRGEFREAARRMALGAAHFTLLAGHPAPRAGSPRGGEG